jgi:hypothetical protein
VSRAGVFRGDSGGVLGRAQRYAVAASKRCERLRAECRQLGEVLDNDGAVASKVSTRITDGYVAKDRRSTWLRSGYAAKPELLRFWDEIAPKYRIFEEQHLPAAFRIDRAAPAFSTVRGRARAFSTSNRTARADGAD